MTALFPLITEGLLLGWSVAWPPGPINAEMMRRALTRGFRSAMSVSAGACTGDFLWALAVSLGAGALSRNPVVAMVLQIISIVLLLFLAWTFLRGARKTWLAKEATATGRFDTPRGGYLVGLTMALSSPWNIGFWLAVIGGGVAERSLGEALTLACAVVSGALLWGLVFTSALHFGARFASRKWQAGTQLLTGILMLAFAVRAILHF